MEVSTKASKMNSKLHDLALSVLPLMSGSTLSARPRADLEREDRPLPWSACARTFVG